MALTYCVLASGSSGNCTWLRGGGVEILVDCGISARRTGLALAELGTSLDRISAVVCTHGHDDHIAGASVLARRHGLTLWATAGTRSWLHRTVPEERRRLLPVDGQIALGGLTVRTLATPHDAPQSVALVVDDGETSLGIVTDLGVATPSVAKGLMGVDGLILEMNHDERMLAEGPYPEHLKKRIRGTFGHLSNAQGAQLLRHLLGAGLQHVTLAHLSEHNNTPDLARAAAERVLKNARKKPALSIADRHRPSSPVQLKARRQLLLPLWRLATARVAVR